jgi:hypothetical protein
VTHSDPASRTASFAIAIAVIALAQSAAAAAAAESADGGASATPGSDAARQRQIARIERELGRVSRNMGPNAWYVLALHDAAQRYTPPQSLGGRAGRSTPRLEGVQITHFVLVQSKSAAAELIYEFLRQTSAAPGELPETAYVHQGRAAKAWEARGFRTESQAASFYNRVAR